MAPAVGIVESGGLCEVTCARVRRRERRPHISRIERRRRRKQDHNQSGARSDERKRLLDQSWRDSCAMGKAIFGSSTVARGYALSAWFGHIPGLVLGLAISARGSFEISRVTSRPQAHTSQESRKGLPRLTVACPSRGAQPNRPKLIPCGARIDGPQNLRRRSRLRSIPL